MKPIRVARFVCMYWIKRVQPFRTLDESCRKALQQLADGCYLLVAALRVHDLGIHVFFLTGLVKHNPRLFPQRKSAVRRPQEFFLLRLLDAAGSVSFRLFLFFF